MTPRLTTHCRKHRSFDLPHYLRPGLLVVFDGAPGSGKTTQLSRLRASQRRSGLFANEPLFLELPRDLDSAEARERRGAARAALAVGTPVFAERWHEDDPRPTVRLLSLTSFTRPDASITAPELPGPEVVVTEPGWESQVTLQLFGVLGRRGLMAGCPCRIAA